MLARKQVVETLQGNRSEAVHLLDQLVRQLPDGIYLRSVRQVGAKVTVVGYAQSNARVSTLMRNIEASPWLSTPGTGGNQAGRDARREGHDAENQRIHAALPDQAHRHRCATATRQALPPSGAPASAARSRRPRLQARNHDPGRTSPPQHSRCRQLAAVAEGRASCVAIFLAIIVAGLFLDWKDQWEALGKAEQVEVGLKTQYAEKKKRAINFDLYVQQLSEVEQSFGALVKQLPNRSEIDALLTDVNQAGLGRGLQFELFKPAAQERMADFYAELPINIKITGNYHDMGAFASDIAQLPRIVTLNDVAISADKGTLAMEAVAKTFRYLDDEEIAKQRAAAKAKAKK